MWHIVASLFKSIINLYLHIILISMIKLKKVHIPDVLKPGLDVKLATSTILTANC